MEEMRGWDVLITRKRHSRQRQQQAQRAWGRDVSLVFKKSYKDPAIPVLGIHLACLENPMDGGAWQAAVHGVAKSQTGLSDFTFTFHFHALEKEMATHSSVFAWRIPGTGGAWWAAVYGVAQCRTQLKRLSSSSSILHWKLKKQKQKRQLRILAFRGLTSPSQLPKAPACGNILWAHCFPHPLSLFLSD